MTVAKEACDRFSRYLAGDLGEDPYLQYRPSFGYSLPAQVFIQGSTFTLLSVLLIHILFTAPYHWPLSRLNYILQISGILLVLGSVLVSVGLTLTADDVRAKQWPYMLQYVGVIIPPPEWTTAQKGAYQLLQCLCNAAVNFAHIQFLTLLFPSPTEVKLIFFILSPITLAASGLSFSALSENRTTIDLGDAIANVFDSTLILIFTISLLLWGCVVNRRRAWRFDGGTAIFGAGSIGLAVISTAINFVLVREDGLNWLQNLTWAVILWQSWLGFWWWTGSGMGIGEVEDMLAKEERHRLKAELRRRERAAKQRRLDGSNRSEGEGSGRAASSLSRSMLEGLKSSGILTHRRRREVINEDIEMDRISPADSGSRALDRDRHISISEEDPRAAERSARPNPSTPSESVSTSSRTPTLYPPTTLQNALTYPFILLQIYVRRLRQGHEAATKAKALDRVERRQRAFASSSSPHGGGRGRGQGGDGDLARPSLAVVNEGSGWGLGSFGIRQAQEARERLGQSRRILQESRLLGPNEDETEEEEGTRTPSSSRQRRRGPVPATEVTTRPTTANERDNEADLSDAELGQAAGPSRSAPGDQDVNEAAFAALSRQVDEEDDSQWVDEGVINIDGGRPATPIRTASRRRRTRRTAAASRSEPESAVPSEDEDANSDREGAGKGWSWWGPFRKWRLADRSTF